MALQFHVPAAMHVSVIAVAPCHSKDKPRKYLPPLDPLPEHERNVPLLLMTKWKKLVPLSLICGPPSPEATMLHWSGTGKGSKPPRFMP